jgi:membrane protein
MLVVMANQFSAKRIFSLLRETYTDWMADNALRLSAALAYYSVFSIAPLLVISIGIAGLVLGEEAVRGQLDDQLKGYFGSQAAEGLQSMIKSSAKPSTGWTSAIVGFATLMLGASGVFGQLKDALNTIWEVKPKSGAGITAFITDRLLNFGMVLVIGFLLLTSLIFSTALAALGDYLGQIAGIAAGAAGVLGFFVSFGLVTLLFAFIYKVLPDARILWKHVWMGAVVTAFLFEIGKWALGWYLGRESTASSFGAAGSVILILLWVYYASCILLFGAEFTQVYARATGHAIVPAAGAEISRPEKTAETPGAKERQLPSESFALPSPRQHPAEKPILIGGLVAILIGAILRRR